MAAQITAFVITLLINITIGVGVFLFMLVAMNGFSESDAEKGLIAYIVLAVGVSILMSTGAYLLTRYLLGRKFKGVAATLIAVPVFSVVGGGLKIVCSIIGIAIAENVRVNY